MYRILNLIPLLFLFSLFSLFNKYTKNYYILNSDVPYNISNGQIAHININSNVDCFRMVIELIGICVTNYFITFNHLFMGCLNLIKDCIVNSYFYSFSILQLITNYPTNYLIFIYLMTKLYLDVRGRAR